MSIVLAIVLAGVSSVGIQFRVLDTGEPFRALERTSLLYGMVEFRVRGTDGTMAQALRVVTDAVTVSGRDPVVCQGPDGGASCVTEFLQIAQRNLRVEYDVVTPAGERRRVTTPVTTLHTHPSPAPRSGGDAVVEHVRSEGTPPDRVTRAIRFETVTGSGDRRRVRYLVGIEATELDVRVGGARGGTVVSLRPPDPDAPMLIPILFDVAPYLRGNTRGGGTTWEDSFAARVIELRQGIADTAAAGFDVEFLVVSYGSDPRLFGPFHPADDASLDALERTLLRPPDKDIRVSEFGSVMHTLNDLYLRGYPGQVQLVWITDGWSAGGGSRFLPDLWPQRLAGLNAAWSLEEYAAILAGLDGGLGLQDAELVTFIASLPPDEPDRAGRILRFLQASDPDATRTLHPHRVDTSPMMNCLFIPSERSLRGERYEQFRAFVEQRWGGNLVRYLPPDRSNPDRRVPAAETLSGLLRLTAEQMIHSGRIELDVPNPKQDGARRDIRIKVGRKRVRARFMPEYTSSRSRDERLAGFLASPFKSLRVLAAYETRFHPFDDALLETARERWRVESDPQVRVVAFESWISVQLQRLQVGDDRGRAHDALVFIGGEAERLPSPALARDAAAAAAWYRARHSD